MDLLTTITLGAATVVAGGADWPHSTDSQTVGTFEIAQDIWVWSQPYRHRRVEMQVIYRHESYIDDRNDRGYEAVGLELSTSW